MSSTNSTDGPGIRPAGSARRATLRKFGAVMAAALAVLAAVSWLRGGAAAPWLAVPAVVFLVFAVLWPAPLDPLERAWMKLAAALGTVTTVVVLTVTFLVVFTPMRLIRQAFGIDSLGLRFDPNRRSYWQPAEDDGPCSRPDKPY